MARKMCALAPGLLLHSEEVRMGAVGGDMRGTVSRLGL
jgi:hypothetical protein